MQELLDEDPDGVLRDIRELLKLGQYWHSSPSGEKKGQLSPRWTDVIRATAWSNKGFMTRATGLGCSNMLPTSGDTTATTAAVSRLTANLITRLGVLVPPPAPKSAADFFKRKAPVSEPQPEPKRARSASADAIVID